MACGQLLFRGLSRCNYKLTKCMPNGPFTIMMSWGEKVDIKYMETSCFRVFMLLNYMQAYVSMYFLHLMITFPPKKDVMVNGPLSLFSCTVQVLKEPFPLMAVFLSSPQSASSGRMAELLGGDGGGFIGFEAVSGGAVGGEGNGEGEGVAFLGQGAEFQVVMKQLGKRDTTTKIKVTLDLYVL